MTRWVPCWDLSEEATIRERATQHEQRLATEVDPERANRLAEIEQRACAGLPASERSHSPLDHKRAIAEVLFHREAGALRGVRIVFKPIPGLTADYVRQAFACQRARYDTLDQPASYQPDDPTLFEGTTVTVTEHQGQVEVMIDSDDDRIARIVCDRAEDLVRERAATR